MRDLLQIIEQLQVIDTVVLEKDKYIHNYKDIVALCTQMILDPDFIQAIGDNNELKEKYITPIEAKIKAVESLQRITIDPQVNLPEPATKPRQKRVTKTTPYTASQIVDIYMPPGDRKILARRLSKEARTQAKDKDKDKAPSTQSKAPASTKAPPKANVTTGIMEEEEDEDEANPSQEGYIEVEHGDQYYYIDTHAMNPDELPLTYFVYATGDNEELQLAGHLKGDTLTLLNNDNLDQSQTIKLPTKAGDPSLGSILAHYVLNEQS